MKQMNVENALRATSKSRSPSPEPLTYVQEQSLLRSETIAAFHDGDQGADGEEDDLLVLREKTQDELDREEQEYREFLEREAGGDLKELISIEEGGVRVDDNESEDGFQPKKKKKKKKKKRGVQDAETEKPKTKDEENQEFLLKYVCYSPGYSLLR